MATMKAARVHQWGGPEQVVVENTPQPEPTPDDVLVKVHAAGVNTVDWVTREGYLWYPVPLPMTLGWDVAGEVAAVGANVRNFQPGDAVYGMIQFRGGAFAEYALLRESELALKPKRLDFVEAAALPAVALTAWQTLVDIAQVKTGQTVLVQAAAGGVGSVTVPLAKHLGAHVTGTASAANEAFVRELGVDVFIDYQTTRFEEVVHDIDVVIESMGADTLERSYGVVKPGGILIELRQQPSEERAAQHGIRTQLFAVQPSREQLGEIAALVDAGVVKAHVSKVLPLDEVRQALDLSQSGHVRGKIVLTIP
jgi:NADPH:quinone reductase-like Zn-dependent oxidoreductase